MSPYKRNIMVGLTVLIALVLLGLMILRFSDAPFRLLFAKEQMPITFRSENAEGLGEGSPVLYLGVNVGRVTKVTRDPDFRNVTIETLIDTEPPLPGNLEGGIRTQIIGGAAALILVLKDSPAATSPAPQGILQASAQLPAVHIGNDLLPKELSTLATSFSETSTEFRELARQFRQSDIVPKIAGVIDAVKVDVEKAGKVLDSIHSLVDDPEMRKNLSATLANLRSTSESAVKIGQHLEKLSVSAQNRLDEISASGTKLLNNTDERMETVSKQVTARMEQLSRVLDNFDAASRKLHEGRGSAAMLLNDPVLYENLLDTSKELKLTFSDFRRLLEQWEQEGLSFKLK